MNDLFRKPSSTFLSPSSSSSIQTEIDGQDKSLDYSNSISLMSMLKQHQRSLATQTNNSNSNNNNNSVVVNVNEQTKNGQQQAAGTVPSSLSSSSLSRPWLNKNNQNGTVIHFSANHKMSLFSLEKRIDYHLSRIMKGHRLINFKNSIERLPTEKRICECIIEILMSSLNLIARKTKIISCAKMMIDHLNEKANGLNNKTLKLTFSSKDYRLVYVERLQEVKALAIALEQIVWALNSNKEHIKYISKVFAVPEKYQRSEFANDPSSVVPLKHSIMQAIEQCQEVIHICRILRAQILDAIIRSFIAHF